MDPAALLTRCFNEPCDEMVLVRDIEFLSFCEHHLLPFEGVAHVAYIPRDAVVGLSKIPRLVDGFARRFQIQERLTRQVAEAMMEHLNPLGVGVVMTARHGCVRHRGIANSGATMTTSCLLGAMRENAEARREFLALVQG